jgi:GTP-binding protein
MKKIDITKIFPIHGEQACEFILGAHNASQFPETRYPEFAFIGASNVGKSSLVNALVRQKIAITSNTPGRTRQLNFFLLSEKIMIVDMPGYGFAKAGERQIEHWQKTSFQYFANRAQLKRVFMLVDPVKGLKKADFDIANIFNSTGINFQIVLTKADKIKHEELLEAKKEIAKQAKLWAALHPHIIVTSSKENEGLDELKREMISYL